MIPRRFIAAAIGASLLWSLTAPAQQIHWPRLGRPAIATPGGSVEVAVDSQGAVRLEGSGHSVALEVAWGDAAAGSMRGVCTLPGDIATGRYDLTFTSTAGTVSRRAAVHVLGEFPESYSVAVVRGVPPTAGDEAVPVLPPDLAERLRAAEVQLGIIIGPLTRQGTEEEYRALEERLLAAEIPVFVCPDGVDVQTDRFEAAFGDRIHGLRFGRDAYLFLGEGLSAFDPRTHERLGQAHLLRRAMRASRWSVGVAGRYELDWDFRAQVALFVDDPLNYLVAGTVTAGLGHGVPWGNTVYVLPPDAPRTGLGVFEVTPLGIRLREPSAPAADAPAPPAEQATPAAG